MRQFELDYALMVRTVLLGGEIRHCRNGVTFSKFAQVLNILDVGSNIPLIQGRQMFFRGVFGEFAAFVRGPKHLSDFEQFGCNYWKQWAAEDGSLELDYGNAWLEGGQIDHVVNCLNRNPNDRRMLITGWKPDRLPSLSLPCCHYAYQFYVRHGKEGKSYIDILWHQRSTDLMVGLPSDIILAYLWLVALCKATTLDKYTPGNIYMTLGDTHIYQEHKAGAEEYIKWAFNHSGVRPVFVYDVPQGTPVTAFDPSKCKVLDYVHLSTIKFEVKA